MNNLTVYYIGNFQKYMPSIVFDIIKEKKSKNDWKKTLLLTAPTKKVQRNGRRKGQCREERCPDAFLSFSALPTSSNLFFLPFCLLKKKKSYSIVQREANNLLWVETVENIPPQQSSTSTFHTVLIPSSIIL